ncbi:MAG TPA: DNA polymerase I [Steroidobacteraceae bacterium]|jgi:DNA polymerase-1|nr:DNA polymerase I [Steroidobacteraceae bacterium]
MPLPTRPDLVLIDGSSYLYRAFHALPPLTNSAGQPTGAVHGVLSMLLKFLREFEPPHIGVVFDAPGRTFRDDLFAEYKANRPPMPDDLRAQTEPLLEAVEGLGLPLLRIDGVEADDVIGTLAARAAAGGQQVLISTGDKDMAQLVNEHITLVNTMSNTVLDRAGVKAKFDVFPEQIIDYLALVGDSSDNIPGIDKVGPKTAAKWLNKYGTLDALLAHAVEIEGKVGDNLRAGLTTLALSRQLATIRCDLDLPLDEAGLVRRAADTARLRVLYRRLELRTLLQQLETTAAAATAAAAGTVTAGATSAGATGGVAVPVPPVDSAAINETAAAIELPQPADPAAAALASVPRRYDTVMDWDALSRWIEALKAAELFAFDTETTSLDYMTTEIVGVSFCIEPGHSAYVPLAHDYAGAPAQLDRAQVLEALRPLLEDPGHGKVGQHLKFDIHVLQNYGVQLQGQRYDTMLESYVLNSTATRHDMDSMAAHLLGMRTIHFEDVAGKGAKQITFNQVSVEKAAEYSAEDADVTLRLHRVLWPRLAQVPALAWVYLEIEQPLVPVLQRMERHGVLIDRDMLHAQSGEIALRLREIEALAHIEAGAPFNLESPKQLQQILFERLQLPVTRKTPSGTPSTAEDVLEELAADYALPRLILEYRGLAKLRSTYTERLPEQINPATGRVHTSYHQAVAATGRLSSTDPNLQNIPIRSPEGRRIRQAFIAPPGQRLLAADYSQIELRIMAHLSGDEGLLRAFAEDRDIHQATAAEVFGVALDQVSGEQRRSAKAINFGLIYGMSAFGLARQLGIARSAAQSYVELYFARYPGVRRYMDATREQARRDGYVETVFGRRLYLPEIRSRNRQLQQYAERSAINAPMQGTAADIIKRAMITIDAWCQRPEVPAKLLMQVHDELVLEVSEDYLEQAALEVGMRMSGAAQLAVPLKVEIGTGLNWDQAH